MFGFVLCYISVCTNGYFKYSLLLLGIISTIKKLSKYSVFCLKSLDRSQWILVSTWDGLRNVKKACGRKVHLYSSTGSIVNQLFKVNFIEMSFASNKKPTNNKKSTFEMHNSMSFHKCVNPHNQQQNQDIKHFHHLRKSPGVPFQATPTPRGNSYSEFYLHWVFCLPLTLYKWNHVICTVLFLASLAHHNTFELHLFCCLAFTFESKSHLI